ncbi:MAG: FAD/FMN-containing dehydrogenase [Pseudomonadota bacterium]
MRSMLAALLLLPALAMADEQGTMLKVGDPLPTFQLNDQHDKPMPIGDDTRMVLFTADKSAGDMLNGLLKERPGDFMVQRKIVYIADISRMPGFITSMVALPKMRDYAYRMAVGMEEAQTMMLPRAEDSVTVLGLEAGKVKSIQQFNESKAAALAALLDAAPVVQAEPARAP